MLHIEHAWSAEQGPRLYGFVSREDRSAFRLLQSIQGVGPKAALSVLDILPRRLPNLRLTPGQAFTFVPNASFRTPRALQAEWDRGAVH